MSDETPRQTAWTETTRQAVEGAIVLLKQDCAAPIAAEAVRAALAEIARLQADRQKIVDALHLEHEDGLWWTFNENGEVECDSFAEAVLKTFCFAENDIKALTTDLMNARLDARRKDQQ